VPASAGKIYQIGQPWGQCRMISIAPFVHFLGEAADDRFQRQAGLEWQSLPGDRRRHSGVSTIAQEFLPQASATCVLPTGALTFADRDEVCDLLGAEPPTGSARN
jgi:hypothetical protein